MEFPTSRAAALDHLESFLPKCRLYARDRNFVSPGHPNVSRLSPMLRHRLVMEGEVADAAIQSHGFDRVEKFVQEVYWRRYWKAWLSLRPHVWREACAFPGPAERSVAGARATGVMNADSGNAVIDHFSSELVTTGYLHNHARMWFAAWWIHEARLPWQWGAAFFMRHLLDGDPASNTLSWRWVAGLQTPGKTYLARRANLEKYLDPTLIDVVSSGLDAFENPTPNLPDSVSKTEITRAVLADEPTPGEVASGLWIHEEDLVPEHSALGQREFDALMVTGHPAGWRRHGYSPLRIEWLRHALADSANRAAAHWRRAARLETPDDLAAFLTSWALDHGLRQILTLRPDVGPLDDDLERIRAALAREGIRLVCIDRPHDLAMRPLAKRGFFDFWKRLGPQLRENHEPGLFPAGSHFSK